MSLIEKVVYRAQVKQTASRDTRMVSSDWMLDLKVGGQFSAQVTALDRYQR